MRMMFFSLMAFACLSLPSAGQSEPVLAWFRDNWFGHAPGRPSDETFDDAGVTCAGGRICIAVSESLPAGTSPSNPAPVFVFGDHFNADTSVGGMATYPGIPTNSITARGYAYVSFNFNDIAPNDYAAVEDEPRLLAKNKMCVEYGAQCPDGAKGTLSAWAWGFSRVMDWIETRPELNSRRVAIVGHSRGGKAALWAGAQDGRIALTVANESGAGGARLMREKLPGAEQIADFRREGVGHWFADTFHTYAGREAELSYDAPDLLGLIAPRLVYIASASEDFWGGPVGEFETVRRAAKARGTAFPYAKYPGVGGCVMSGPIGYHVRAGRHKLLPEDWFRFMDFADAHGWNVPPAPFPVFSAPRAVTQGPHDHFLANYFGINAWSPDNRYLLTLETDIKNELPDGAPCTLGLVDLEDGNRFIPIMETRAWNFQEAAMAHWLPNERDTFVVNDFRDGKFVAVVRNWRTGKERVYPFPVSAVSEDGTWALSINYARLYLARPDYGYAGEGQNPRRGVVFPEDDGLWRIDLKTGDAKLLVSCAALKDMVPQVPDAGLSYICHTVISKDMKRVYFLSRSVSQSMEGVKKFKGVNWHTTAFTCDADGTNIRRCFPDGWGSSHFNWKPALSERDARTMIVTCNWQNKVYTHVEFTVGEEDYPRQVGGKEMNFDGHCIYSPDGNFITSDGYWDEKFYRHWKIVRLADNKVKSIGEFFVPEPYRDVYCRCDLHPRWRPDGKQLGFNSVHEGSRQVYVIDVLKLQKQK